MFARFSLGQGLRARAQCAETTHDALGRAVRCQLSAQHVEAHRYLDAYDAVVWGSLDDIATSFARADLSDTQSALRRRPEDHPTRWRDALPTPGKVVWPVIASHFRRREEPTGELPTEPPRATRTPPGPRHRAKGWRRDDPGLRYRRT